MLLSRVTAQWILEDICPHMPEAPNMWILFDAMRIIFCILVVGSKGTDRYLIPH